MTKHDLVIMNDICGAINDIGSIINRLCIEREVLCEINNFGDDDYADRIRGYRDRIAEILMDVEELNAYQFKEECE